jgi:hypothetical protein
MKFLIIVTYLLLSSCVDTSYNYYTDPVSQYTNEIRNRVAVRLRDEMQLRPCGTGGSGLYHITLLALFCNYYKEVDIEKARELLVQAGILFLKTANEHEKARPYLENYPFGLKNIELRFFREDENGPVYSNDKLSVFTLVDGILHYKITPSLGKSITIYEETFAEAAAKLNIQLTPETGLEL